MSGKETVENESLKELVQNLLKEVENLKERVANLEREHKKMKTGQKWV